MDVESSLNVESSVNVESSLNYILSEYRIKNVNRVVLATLNINSIANKFDQLKLMIGNNIDVLVLTETKLDDSFPTAQFVIEGFATPYRLDRNRHGEV